MRKFILEIDLGNDAMDNSADVAKALKDISERLERAEYDFAQYLVRGISDVNGNYVGSWRVTEKP